MDVLDARAIRFDHVFLLGVSEGQFPRRIAEGSLIRRGRPPGMVRQGPASGLPRRPQRPRNAAVLPAISRAQQSLTLSYLQADAAGAPLAASSFLLSALAPLGGLAALEAATASTIDFNRVNSFRPTRTWPVARTRSMPPPPGFSGATGGKRRRPGLGAGESACAAYLGRLGPVCPAPPLAGRPCDGYDGRITDPPLLDRLARAFGPEAVFSASQLNAFGLCPWQFFGTYVLHLAPLAEPAAATGAHRSRHLPVTTFCADW